MMPPLFALLPAAPLGEPVHQDQGVPAGAKAQRDANDQAVVDTSTSIEAVIGHQKTADRLARNCLRGGLGAQMSAMLAAIG